VGGGRGVFGARRAPPAACPWGPDVAAHGQADVWMDKGRLRWMMPPLDTGPLSTWLDKAAMVGHEWGAPMPPCYERAAEQVAGVGAAGAGAAERQPGREARAGVEELTAVLAGGRQCVADECKAAAACSSSDAPMHAHGGLWLHWCSKRAMEAALSLEDLVQLAARQLAGILYAESSQALGCAATVMETTIPDEDCTITCLATALPLCGWGAAGPRAHGSAMRALACAATPAGSGAGEPWAAMLAALVSMTAALGRTREQPSAEDAQTTLGAAKGVLLAAHRRRACRLERASASSWADRLVASVECHQTLQLPAVSCAS
jgi:hypothetical protein